jgi:integrase
MKLNLYTRWGAMHCFRRFRAAVLKKNRCPDDLAKFWLGHQNRDTTSDYAEQLREDVEWRQQVAADMGPWFHAADGWFFPAVSNKLQPSVS